MSATNSCQLIGRVAGPGIRVGSFALRVAGSRWVCVVDVLSSITPPEGALVAVRSQVTSDAAGAYFHAADLDILADPVNREMPRAKPQGKDAEAEHLDDDAGDVKQPMGESQ